MIFHVWSIHETETDIEPLVVVAPDKGVLKSFLNEDRPDRKERTPFRIFCSCRCEFTHDYLIEEVVVNLVLNESGGIVTAVDPSPNVKPLVRMLAVAVS